MSGPPTKPPPKPVRTAPDGSKFARVNQDIVPGVPRQNQLRQPVGASTVQAAREAARASSPELQDYKIEALSHRVGYVENRLDDLNVGQERVVKSLDSLAETVKEWELTATGGDALKVQEEQKTKRFMALIGVLTMIVAPGLTILGNYLTKDTTESKPTPVLKARMQIEMEACADAPSDQAWDKCITDTAIRNAPVRKH